MVMVGGFGMLGRGGVQVGWDVKNECGLGGVGCKEGFWCGWHVRNGCG